MYDGVVHRNFHIIGRVSWHSNEEDVLQMLDLVKKHVSKSSKSARSLVLVPYTRESGGREDSPGVEELSLSGFSKRDFSAAAAASSSCFFFLNRVSAIGRKKVQSNPYCLQC